MFSLFGTKKFADFEFVIGRGADYILIADDHVILSSFGGIERLSIVNGADKSSEWRIESMVDDTVSVLYSGSLSEVKDRFDLIKQRCAPRTAVHRPVCFSTVLAASLLSVFAAVGLFGEGSIARNATLQTTNAVSGDVGVSPDYLPMLLQSLRDGGDLRALLPQTAHSVPKQIVPGGDPSVPVRAGGSAALPSYNSGLYNEISKTATPVAAPTTDAAKEEVAETSSTKVVTEDEQLKSRLKGLEGLSPEQSKEALRKISMLTPEQLTGDAIASLPAEVRSVLEGTYADGKVSATNTSGIDSVDEDGTPTKLIILPPQVIETYRSYDGIASIPENQSWQAKGNPVVHLPLPGGGDIKSVSDLEKFGLKP